MFTVLVASLALASGLASIVASMATNLGITGFGESAKLIPGFSPQLGIAKSFDLIYFGVFAVVVGGIVLINMWDKKKEIMGPWNLGYLVCAVLVFLQTHFVRFSSKEVVIFVVVMQSMYLLGKKWNWGRLGWASWIESANGVLVGLYLMFLVRPFSTSLIFVLGSIVLGILAYQVLANKFKWVKSPGHLALAVSIVFPWNSTALMMLGLVTAVVVWKVKKYPVWINGHLAVIYAMVGWILVAYDPLFYYGNLDSVEEGFWLAWVQRLMSGQVLYKDFASYQPPLLTWGLYGFMKIFGVSVYYARLYFQILKIMGLVMMFFVGSRLLKQKSNVVMYGLAVLALVSNLVKNNVEIRLGIGFLAVYLVTIKKSLWAGVLSIVTLGVSLEAGVAALVATGCTAVIWGSKSFVRWIIGVGVTGGVLAFSLAMQGGLISAIAQIGTYAKAFSNGYFNIAVERPVLENMLMWWRVDRFLSSLAGSWEVVMWGVGLVIGFFVYRIIKKAIITSDKLALGLAIYSGILARAALGRSDWYHLLFLMLGVLLVVVYIVETFATEEKARGAVVGLWVIFALVLNRELVSQKFVNNMIFKLGSYANVSQNYLQYKSYRAGIAVDIDVDVKSMDGLIEYVQANSSKTDKIFVYPWGPEIYFLTNRNNATSFDMPYAFFDKNYQNQMVSELKAQSPKFVIYNPEKNFGGMNAGSLETVKSYILANYTEVIRFGQDRIMTINALVVNTSPSKKLVGR